MIRRSLLLLPLFALACRNAAPTVAEKSIADRAHDDLYFLAGPEADGRGVGTPGLAKAADFIEARFKKLGLQPVPGLDGYRQPFPMNLGMKTAADNILAGPDATVLRLDVDYRTLGWSPSREFAGDVAFVGYGIADKNRGYDDYAGVDVSGKVVMVMRYEPHDEKGKSRWSGEGSTRGARLFEKARAATSAGASAIVIVNPAVHGNDGKPNADELVPFSGAGGGRSTIPVLSVTRKIADAWLAAGGQPTIEDLQKRIDAGNKPASVVLENVRVSGKTSVEPRRENVFNIAAMLPGVGPRADEFVVVGAHYDHLGHGGMGSMNPSSTAVHPGADDDGSGTVAVLGVAETLAKAGPLPRSVIFLTFTAEESGLLGSEHFVEHPPIDLKKVAAMVNLDMVGRVKNDMLYVGGAGTAASFDELTRAIDAASPLTLADMGRGGKGPSDHESFSGKDIPVLFFFSGMHPQYHRPTDTPDLINYDGIAQVVALASDTVTRMADLPKPSYVDKYDADGINVNIVAGTTRPVAPKHRDPGQPEGRRLRLGVVPEMDESGLPGLGVSEVTPTGPAGKAGVVAGDRILKLNGETLDGLESMQAVLADLKPGSAVPLEVKRGEQTLTLEVRFDAPATSPRPGTTTRPATTRSAS